jgi:hypothetical protein
VRASLSQATSVDSSPPREPKDRNQRPAVKLERGPDVASNPAGLSLEPYMRSRTKSMVVRFKQFSDEYREAEEIYV